MPSTLERVLAKVSVTDGGCWEFNGSRISGGYGRASHNGRLWLAHRLVYTLMAGEIPAGLELDHLCKNKPCCNPGHLEAVTRGENIRRGPQGGITAARERAKTQCPAGHAYDGANTYWTPQGHRQCRACKRTAISRYSQRNRTVIAERQRTYRARRRASA